MLTYGRIDANHDVGTNPEQEEKSLLEMAKMVDLH
jgi:hypothetical protein